LFVGKAEVVEDYAEQINSVSFSMAMPAVVRLMRAARRHRRQVRFSRTHVWLRDGHRCQYCGDAKRAEELTYDHVLPRSRGGVTSWENIVTACRPCNFAKANRTPSEAGLSLLKRPVEPRWLPPLRSLSAHAVPELWRTFLPASA
jgi:5-methylcytosine-specific restriction endonuclease McrA